MNPTFHLWILDDSPSNLRMIERSLPDAVRSVLHARAFEDAREFLAVFANCFESPLETPPDFVVLDFFLGCMYGSEVFDRIRRSCELAGATMPVVIAFSSLPEASDSMVDRGADFALRKVCGRPTSPEIQHTFRSLEAIEHLKRSRRPFTAG